MGEVIEVHIGGTVIGVVRKHDENWFIPKPNFPRKDYHRPMGASTTLEEAVADMICAWAQNNPTHRKMYVAWGK